MFEGSLRAWHTPGHLRVCFTLFAGLRRAHREGHCRQRREEGLSGAGVPAQAQRRTAVPLVRIAVNRKPDAAYAAAIGDAVHRALVETMNVPADDKFQIISSADSAHLVYPQEYLGVRHSEAVVIIQITLNAGRTVDQKRALLRASPTCWPPRRAFRART
jgi:hypothetical protein